jgi:hypothetical protein
MPKYKVTITTTFKKDIFVETETKQEAKVMTLDMIDDGIVDGTDTDTFDTEITEIEEVE